MDAVPPAVDGHLRPLRPRCDSLPRQQSIWLGVLLSVVVLIVLPQGEMKRTIFDVGMRCSGEEESPAVHDSSVYIGHVSFCRSVAHSRYTHDSVY